MRKIKKIAVIGSGIMGSRIACHFANIGVEVLLLDIINQEKNNSKNDQKLFRNKIVNTALKNTLKSKPSAIYSQSYVNRIQTGNLIDDLTLVTSVTTSLETGDSSSEWASSGSTISSLGVNETGTIKVNTSIPLDAWSGSSVDVMVTALAQGQEITTFSFSVVSGHVPSWNAVIDQANLEVDPRGSEITLSVLIISQCLFSDLFLSNCFFISDSLPNK